MLVGSRFAEDRDEATMWLQHDAYHQVLGLLHAEACRAWLLAEDILGTSTEEGRVLRAQTGFDHRILQDAHDLVAAWFRYRGGYRQPRLPFAPPEAVRVEWLAFAAREAADLARRPAFVRAVAKALAWANTPAGYAAEDDMRAFLRDRYHSMLEQRPPRDEPAA